MLLYLDTKRTQIVPFPVSKSPKDTKLTQGKLKKNQKKEPKKSTTLPGSY